MASPCWGATPAPSISASALVHTLSTLEHRDTRPEHAPLACEHQAYYRNCCLQICSNVEIYDSIRDIIPDASYWAKEEAHFEVMFGIVLDYNSEAGANMSEMECPPVTWLRDIWNRRQRSLQVVMQGKWSTGNTGAQSGHSWLLETPPFSCSSLSASRVAKHRRHSTRVGRRPVTRSSTLCDGPPSTRTRGKKTLKTRLRRV